MKKALDQMEKDFLALIQAGEYDKFHEEIQASLEAAGAPAQVRRQVEIEYAHGTSFPSDKDFALQEISDACDRMIAIWRGFMDGPG